MLSFLLGLQFRTNNTFNLFVKREFQKLKNSSIQIKYFITLFFSENLVPEIKSRKSNCNNMYITKNRVLIKNTHNFFLIYLLINKINICLENI